jgi:hypothetical protein
MYEEQLKQYGQIVAKCWADAEFKARFLADPKRTLAAEGVAVPEGGELRIVENTADLRYLVLPSQPGEGELSDESLSEIAGGSPPCACYITTATLKACGLGEAESESILAVFRSFRDDWLRLRPEGPKVIADYYRTAPALVAALDREPESSRLYQGLWNQFLLPWMKAIEHGDPETAYRIYLNMVDGLLARYP